MTGEKIFEEMAHDILKYIMRDMTDDVGVVCNTAYFNNYRF